MPRKKKGPPFVMLDKRMLRGEPWKELSHTEQIAYIYIKANFNGSNNGEIPLTYSELEGILGHKTVWKALKGLEQKGWIRKTQHGGLYRYYCLYELTGTHDPQIK